MQDLQSIHFRQLQIEQQDSRIVGGASAVLPPAIEVIQSFLSVTGDDDLIGQVVFFQRRQSKLPISRIVLNHQNPSSPAPIPNAPVRKVRHYRTSVPIASRVWASR